jgi:hypothetical protein
MQQVHSTAVTDVIIMYGVSVSMPTLVVLLLVHTYTLLLLHCTLTGCSRG